MVDSLGRLNTASVSVSELEQPHPLADYVFGSNNVPDADSTSGAVDDATVLAAVKSAYTACNPPNVGVYDPEFVGLIARRTP
jgi:hypothetical protein